MPPQGFNFNPYQGRRHHHNRNNQSNTKQPGKIAKTPTGATSALPSTGCVDCTELARLRAKVLSAQKKLDEVYNALNQALSKQPDCTQDQMTQKPEAASNQPEKVPIQQVSQTVEGPQPVKVPEISQTPEVSQVPGADQFPQTPQSLQTTQPPSIEMQPPVVSNPAPIVDNSLRNDAGADKVSNIPATPVQPTVNIEPQSSPLDPTKPTDALVTQDINKTNTNGPEATDDDFEDDDTDEESPKSVELPSVVTPEAVMNNKPTDEIANKQPNVDNVPDNNIVAASKPESSPQVQTAPESLLDLMTDDSSPFPEDPNSPMYQNGSVEKPKIPESALPGSVQDGVAAQGELNPSSVEAVPIENQQQPMNSAELQKNVPAPIDTPVVVGPAQLQPPQTDQQQPTSLSGTEQLPVDNPAIPAAALSNSSPASQIANPVEPLAVQKPVGSESNDDDDDDEDADYEEDGDEDDDQSEAAIPDTQSSQAPPEQVKPQDSAPVNPSDGGFPLKPLFDPHAIGSNSEPSIEDSEAINNNQPTPTAGTGGPASQLAMSGRSGGHLENFSLGQQQGQSDQIISNEPLVEQKPIGNDHQTGPVDVNQSEASAPVDVVVAAPSGIPSIPSNQIEQPNSNEVQQNQQIGTEQNKTPTVVDAIKPPEQQQPESQPNNQLDFPVVELQDEQDNDKLNNLLDGPVSKMLGNKRSKRYDSSSTTESFVGDAAATELPEEEDYSESSSNNWSSSQTSSKSSSNSHHKVKNSVTPQASDILGKQAQTIQPNSGQQQSSFSQSAAYNQQKIQLFNTNTIANPPENANGFAFAGTRNGNGNGTPFTFGAAALADGQQSRNQHGRHNIFHRHDKQHHIRDFMGRKLNNLRDHVEDSVHDNPLVNGFIEKAKNHGRPVAMNAYHQAGDVFDSIYQGVHRRNEQRRFNRMLGPVQQQQQASPLQRGVPDMLGQYPNVPPAAIKLQPTGVLQAASPVFSAPKSPFVIQQAKASAAAAAGTNGATQTSFVQTQNGPNFKRTRSFSSSSSSSRSSFFNNFS